MMLFNCSSICCKRHGRNHRRCGSSGAYPITALQKMIKKRSFTLVEVIIAVIMLMIVAVGAPAAYIAQRRHLYRGELERIALWKAVDVMELYRSGQEGVYPRTLDIGDPPHEVVIHVDVDETPIDDLENFIKVTVKVVCAGDADDVFCFLSTYMDRSD